MRIGIAVVIMAVACGMSASACTILDSRGRKVLVVPPPPVVVIEKQDQGKHKGHHKHRDDD